MKNYRLYATSDFVLDEDFIQWINDGTNDRFWQDWLNKNPDRQLIVAEAMQIVQLLNPVTGTLDDASIHREVNRLLNTISDEQDHIVPIRSIQKWWWTAAVLFFVIIGAFFHLNSKKSQTEKYRYASIITGKKLIEQVNATDSPVHIILPDNTQIDLAPNSRLSYAADFKDSASRDVYLQGEAFFNVTKNPKQPFKVFTNELVTKVLGTSFTVRAFEKDNSIKVTVRTGKVNVYSQEFGEATTLTAQKKESVLLTPNQEAVYLKEKKKFEKKLLENPVIIVPKLLEQDMVFENVSVIKVLDILKEGTGISIMYDKEMLNGCTITADLTNESFYTRLELVCKAIDASYEIIDSEIFIHANGCS